MERPAGPYYVALTGSKNNAGDFLIKHRAKQLFAWLRPDRQLVDLDGWKPLSSAALETVNSSRALILLGGPALQEHMRPRVYPLVADLRQITVPIVTMGIGWYSARGQWADTHHYPLNRPTHELLDRIEASGHLSSVRDYHTLNALASHGYKRFVMTGCPALYSQPHLERPVALPDKLGKIGLSLGVSMKSSARMFRQMQELVLAVRRRYASSTVEVVFHHPTGADASNPKNATEKLAHDLHAAQQRFLSWLKSHRIPFVDISGSAERLIEYYESCDLHIGYRVHAHIFMASISRPSILLAEDGRGIALRDVLAGGTMNAYLRRTKNKLVSVAHKLGIPYDDFVPAPNVSADVLRFLETELSGGVRLHQPRRNIALHFAVMKSFLESLP